MNENSAERLPGPSETEIVDVRIAPAGRHIWARLIDTLPILVMAILAGVFFAMSAADGSWTQQNLPADMADIPGRVWFLVLLFAAYVAVQCWLGRVGQSVGKKIMGIRVLKNDGMPSGFLRTVVLREIGFNIVVGLATSILAYLLTFMAGKDDITAELVSNSLALMVTLVCLIMLFNAGKNRRTLQDYFADTVVVEVPKA